jgi:hypothetical protein
MVQSACQPLHSLYRGFGAQLSVTKDTLLVVSPQVVATFCTLTSSPEQCADPSRPGGARKCFSPDPELTSCPIIYHPFRAVVSPSGVLWSADDSYPMPSSHSDTSRQKSQLPRGARRVAFPVPPPRSFLVATARRADSDVQTRSCG